VKLLQNPVVPKDDTASAIMKRPKAALQEEKKQRSKKTLIVASMKS